MPQNSSGDLSDDAKKKVSAHIAEIVKEQVESIRKEGDEQTSRFRKESKRVSAPCPVAAVIGVTLLVLLVTFRGLIVANADIFHSAWLNIFGR